MASQTGPRKRYGLFILAIFMLVLAGVAMFLGMHNFTIRTVGLACSIISVYLVRISNVHARPTLDTAVDSGATLHAEARPGLPIRMVGVGLLLLTGASAFYLYRDDLHGYHNVLPVYLFVAVAVACGLVWAYIHSQRM
jgi:hypothetical protein